jgi:NAD(P)-dependent dehydrogenase (short-subunit alcohol dehydrogenase family)
VLFKARIQLHRSVGEIGNGRATAILLARQGCKVALVDYNVEWAQETKRMIDEEGGVSDVIQADVTVEASCENAVKKTVELFGAVHILINIGKCTVRCSKNHNLV